MTRGPTVVIVAIGDERAARGVQAFGPGGADAPMRRSDEANVAAHRFGKDHRLIAAVIDHDDFDVVAPLAEHGIQSAAQAGAPVERANDEAEERGGGGGRHCCTSASSAAPSAGVRGLAHATIRAGLPATTA